MAIDFSKLKDRQRTTNIEALTKKLQEASGDAKKDYTDEREWKLKGDDAGNGFAIIRFLPSPDEDGLGFVKRYSHGYKNSAGRWFIENCPTTLVLPCPVCDANNELWATGLEANKKIVSNRKRKLNFYSNILVVKDPAAPENEGKVFLFRYGQKIFDKIKSAAMPDFEDEKPIDAFNMFDDGANFKLKMKKVGEFPNYDSSVFDTPGAISQDEEKLKDIYSKTYSLAEFTDPKEFRSYDELKKKFERFESGKTGKEVSSTAEAVTTSDRGQPVARQAVAEETTPPWEEETTSSTPTAASAPAEADPDLAEFQKLLQ